MKKLGQRITPGPFIESVLFDRSRIWDPTHYAFGLPAIKSLTKLDLHSKVTFFVGENGSGKSTMLEAIDLANGLNAEGGSRNMMFATPSIMRPSLTLRVMKNTEKSSTYRVGGTKRCKFKTWQR